MKTYQSPTKDKKTKKNFFVRNLYSIIFGITLLVVAAVITLTLVLTNTRSSNRGDVNVDVPPAGPVYTVPINDYTVGKGASLNKLVYSSTLNQWRTHNGVDIIAAAGADVRSVAAGKVDNVVETNLEGTVVTISHADGLVSIYKGLTDVTVKKGDSVENGSVIGKVAENIMIEQNDGAHIHLEMKKDGKYVDPAKYLPELSSDK